MLNIELIVMGGKDFGTTSIFYLSKYSEFSLKAISCIFFTRKKAMVFYFFLTLSYLKNVFVLGQDL